MCRGASRHDTWSDPDQTARHRSGSHGRAPSRGTGETPLYGTVPLLFGVCGKLSAREPSRGRLSHFVEIHTLPGRFFSRWEFLHDTYEVQSTGYRDNLELQLALTNHFWVSGAMFLRAGRFGCMTSHRGARSQLANSHFDFLGNSIHHRTVTSPKSSFSILTLSVHAGRV